MIQQTKLIKVGGTLYTKVNPTIIEYLGLEEDDLLEIDIIKKLNPSTEVIVK